MGSDVAGLIAAPLGMGSIFKTQGAPGLPALPPPVEESDIARSQYEKDLKKRRNGRASTILTTLGSSNQGGKTVLG